MKINLMVLVHDRPVLMEATVHALMKQLPRRKVSKVILLANDPTAEVLACAEKLAAFYGLTKVVFPSEQRAWNTGNAVNYCIRQHPADIYIKMDDDIFITHSHFVERMVRTLRDPHCGAAVALAPVSQFMGYYCIEKLGLLPEYEERFGQPWNTHWLDGSFRNCELMLWLWEHTLNLSEATQKLLQAQSGYVRTHEQVSIGTVCFSHAFWERMGGFGVNQEQSLTKYLREIGYHFTIDTGNPVFHLGYNWCYGLMMEKVFPRLLEINQQLFAPPPNYPVEKQEDQA